MNGSYLLDTNIVITLFAQERTVLDRLPHADRVFVPSIVLGELFFGAFNSARAERNVARVEEFAAISAVLVCDGATGRVYGQVKQHLRMRGKPIPENDVWIAALSQQHGLILVSRDAHFDEVAGLTRETWNA